MDACLDIDMRRAVWGCWVLGGTETWQEETLKKCHFTTKVTREFKVAEFACLRQDNCNDPFVLGRQ